MINIKNIVPEVYTNTSRDFQLLQKIYSVVLNYCLNSSRNISKNPISEYSDKRLVDLMCSTLGFKTLHEYNNDELFQICKIFIKSLKNKGNINSIKLIVNTLCNLNSIAEDVVIEFDIFDQYCLNIYLSSSFNNTTLLEDLLNYILPNGLTYRIYSQPLVSQSFTQVFEEESDVTASKKSSSSEARIGKSFSEMLVIKNNE